MNRSNPIFVLGILFISVSFFTCGSDTPKITTSSPEALNQFNEGVAFEEKFHDAQAIEKFIAATELDSTFATAYYHQSRSYESGGNLARAKESLEKAKKYGYTKTPLEWMYINAWEKVLQNDLSGAIQSYSDILKEYPNDRHTLFVIGKTYRLAKNYPESVAALKKLIDRYPKYAPAYNQLGYTYYEMEDYELATEMFQKYAELEPNEPNPYDSLGDMYRAQGDYQQAIVQYKKALELKPNFYTSFSNLGKSYLSAGNYDSAIVTYNQFLETFKDRELHREAYADLVEVYLARGQYEKATEFINKVIELSETPFRKSWAIGKKGYLFYLKNNYPAAMEQLNRSLTIFPDAIWSREWRGLVFLKQQKYDQVFSEAEKMKDLIDRYGLKGYQCSYNNLMGSAAMQQGLYDEAIMYFKDSMILDKSSYRYLLATAHFKKGNYAQAAELCEEFFKFNQNHALAHFLLAQVLEKQNKNDLAKNEYQKFLTIWKNADKGLAEVVFAQNAIK
jgi:tetratricopeptide (TPR) repeat protein